MASRIGLLGTKLCVFAITGTLLVPTVATADVVLEWNAIAVSSTTSQGPFLQGRLLAITQLAVFEAVNAVFAEYEPYLGIVTAPPATSADAAAVAAAHRVLTVCLPGMSSVLDASRATSLATIPDGQSKSDGTASRLEYHNQCWYHCWHGTRAQDYRPRAGRPARPGAEGYG